jgi:hypothetical protein
MIPGVRSEGARKAFAHPADSDADGVAGPIDPTGTVRGFGVTHLPLLNEDGALLNGDGAVPGSA